MSQTQFTTAAPAPRAVTADPLILPRPKEVRFTKGQRFVITGGTSLILVETTADRKSPSPLPENALLLLHREIKTRFGLNLPIERQRIGGPITRRLRPGGMIFIGNVGSDAARIGLSAPPRPEGYSLRVNGTPTTAARTAHCAGNDARGTLWAVQTLIQLLKKDARTGQVYVPAVNVRDWPTLAFRGVHLFHGKNALPFHTKLIEHLFSRFKMNALVLQAERTRWDSIDKRIAAPWWGEKADIAAEIALARTRGMITYPLIESYGHMGWLLDNDVYRKYAEDPQKPFAINIGDVEAIALMEKINAEVDDLFDAPAFHIGFDEIDLENRGRMPNPERDHNKTFPELVLSAARHWQNFFTKRGKETWMWADEALFKDDVSPSFGTAKNAADAKFLRDNLPKNIGMFDWQYTRYNSYPSLPRLKSAGFGNVFASSWFKPDNIHAYARAAAANNLSGMLQTTWAGYESAEFVLVKERRQFNAMVLAADYFWNGGAGPAPDKLPYDYEAVFDALWKA